MSAIKELLQSQTEWQDATDQALYDTGRCMASLANGAWTDDNTAVWAPSREWLAETKQQLKDLEAMLAELETAHDCL